MAIIKKNGIEGKICSTCHKWKPLTENFPQILLMVNRKAGGTVDARNAIVY